MISLYGSLARMFEKKYKCPAKNIPIPVTSAAEMMRAMEANFKGFRAVLKRSGLYRVARGRSVYDKGLDPEEITMNFSDTIWHIMPVAAGAKSGWGTAILGAVLIGVSFFVPIGSSFLFGTGASMVFGGVAQELAPNPGAGDYAERENPEARPSYLSSNPVNTVEPGLTMPVGYGDCWCGSITVSAGIKVENI